MARLGCQGHTSRVLARRAKLTRGLGVPLRGSEPRGHLVWGCSDLPGHAVWGVERPNTGACQIWVQTPPYAWLCM